MEGVSCQQVGCYCVDFLPFYCKRCNYIYCLEHRSRFIHNCKIFNYNNHDDHDAIIDIDECDADYNTSNNDNDKKESIKDIMFSIENRFNNNDNADNNNTTTATTTNNIKTSNASTISTSNNKYLNNTFTNKMNAFKQKLIQSKSQQAYNIALKTQEMLIKSKAIGNSNIAHDERYYLVCNYYDDIDNTSTDIVTSNNNTNNTKATTSLLSSSSSTTTASMSSASASNPTNRIIYIFISKYKSISELLYHIIQNHPSLYKSSATTTSSKAIQQHQQQQKSTEQCHLVITTSDTPDWKEWNRNLIVKDVLRNYEEINIQLIDKSIVLENQHRLSSIQSAKSISSPSSSSTSSSSIATKVLENNNHNQVNLIGNELTTPYKKGQLLWYHKVPVEVTSSSTIQIMEEQQYMLLVKVIDVHHDDFPNIYYTIKAIIPTQTTTTTTTTSTSLIFEQEKQTDFYHLCTLSQHSIDRYKSFSSTPSLSSLTTTSVFNKTNIKNDNKTAEQIALKDLQESLCKLGTNINLNISHSNKQYIITIGSNCTISQLKILISATINISIPDMKLIFKGNILKNNHQKIIETKLINNSKIIVMSSTGK